jgi:excisionase family DNA binding protein
MTNNQNQAKPSQDRPIPRLLSAVEVAELLTVSVSTVWRLRSQGVLPDAVRIGGSVRWRLRDIERYIETL